MKEKGKKIKNWERENEFLERKMYRLYRDNFAKRRKMILDLMKVKKIETVKG